MSNNSSQFGLLAELNKQFSDQRQLHIGIIGCGEMGCDLITQFSMMSGMKLCAVADHKPIRIINAVKIAYDDIESVTEVCNNQQLTTAIEAGKIAATDDSDLLLKNELIDIIIDATGSPNAGATIALKAFSHNKHLVSMSVETDVTIGCYLNHLAKKANLIYSIGAGDEPSACMELINFVSDMQLTIVCAGKGKNNPLNIDATPDLYMQEALERQMNPRMLVEFVDGSKTMVEMACLANATGLITDCAGMHGPAAGLKDLSKIFIPKSDGGILSNVGRVDYSIGKDIAPGVFVVAKTDHPRILERLKDLKMGQGPYFTFFRPYHLTSLEVPLTCARIALYNKPDLAPLPTPTVEVCAVAKKDMHANVKLDSIGEYCYRAWSMSYIEAQKQGAIPCGLLKDATTLKYIKKGELLTNENVSINVNSPIAQLHDLQKIYLNNISR
ncbi:NAD(P)H-dependent oxidoreductase [Bartonella sp. DGB1]|uniref:NAD(P)H-dependent oxidoreductase n=1 Tax=Bartonella sp. DGB1 TaxID=3239807 RepID=UPI003523695E